MAEKPYDRLDGVIWYDGRLVPWGDATLHVLSHGLHYASSVFEGERAYSGEIFKCTEHSERLKRSAHLLDFEIPYTVAEIDAAMMLDWQGRVAECTGANIFFINAGRIHTPIADCFLDGITRQTVIDLAKRRGIEIVERRIMPDELTQFSECFITGSAAEVTAVSEIAHWRFTPGAITQQLMADYTAEVQPKGKKAAA